MIKYNHFDIECGLMDGNGITPYHVFGPMISGLQRYEVTTSSEYQAKIYVDRILKAIGGIRHYDFDSPRPESNAIQT